MNLNITLRKTNGEIIVKVLNSLAKTQKLNCRFEYNKKTSKIRAYGDHDNIEHCRASYMDLFNSIELPAP